MLEVVFIVFLIWLFNYEINKNNKRYVKVDRG